VIGVLGRYLIGANNFSAASGGGHGGMAVGALEQTLEDAKAGSSAAAAGRTAVDVKLEKIEKHFRSVTALYPTSLHIAPGRMTALLGPSGCGKTTTLRIIAGLEAPDAGVVFLGGRDVTRTPPNKRALGMVFQSYSLFPHMTVGENIAFGLKMAGTAGAEIARRVEDMLALVRLPHIEERYPRQLSGGQQQRVALARALVTNPGVLLLDEPLAALDRNLREEMQFEIRRIQTSLEITTVIVTHDQEEALTMSDEVVVMDHGRVVQVGTPSDVYERPRTRFIAEFLGTANLFSAQTDGGGGVVMSLPGADVRPRVAFHTADGGPGQAVTVAVRPEKVLLTPGDAVPGDAVAGDGAIALPAVVTGHVFRGTSHVFQLAVDGREKPLVVYQQAERAGGAAIGIGERVTISWRPENAVVLDKDNAQNGSNND
ncbi:MAG: ABC transporter ATP-binding protein, partial [Pseudomonadota bacterium]